MFENSRTMTWSQGVGSGGTEVLGAGKHGKVAGGKGWAEQCNDRSAAAPPLNVTAATTRTGVGT